MRNIPYINLPAQHSSLKPAILKAVEKVLDHGNFILGEEVGQFEEKIAAYCGTKYAVGLNSGTDALILVLKAYGIGAGDEVITTPNSFLATALAIQSVGAKTVFVDVNADLNMNPDLVAAKITAKTKAVLPVHLTGKPTDMAPILDLARSKNLKVIEDAAQAIGAEYQGKKVGALGDAGCFSLHPLKTLNACGDGGVVTTNDQKLVSRLKQLRNIGLKNRDESEMWGYNSRLDTLQAAILNLKMDMLEEWTLARRQNAQIYRKLFSAGKFPDFLELPQELSNGRHVYHTFVIQTDYRDGLQSYLNDKGIGTKIHYPIPIHLQVCAKELGYKKGDFPVCERTCQRILSLPVYQGLKEEDLDYVVSTIAQYFNKGVYHG
ncbi:MAG: cell wall biogenesis protein [Deltaproteobacteria bacterium RIFCSPLOWO2_02_FULL_46_8]|nr:MAG: cell wall biogenesis protein [Deltaproteobacteria bacterium RIFCSPLOWO2_02_FULL_46_8]